MTVYEFNRGDVYYSVGPLQSGTIEQWVFTNDRHDQNRLLLGNAFPTQQEAEHLKKYIENYIDDSFWPTNS